MVARGDLGAQIPFEDVPSVQARGAADGARAQRTCRARPGVRPPLGAPPGGLRFKAPPPALSSPLPQKDLILRCRQRGKPVIVASHLLQSMHEVPTPTRAEVRAAPEGGQAGGGRGGGGRG